jgi:hypothetical protein
MHQSLRRQGLDRFPHHGAADTQLRAQRSFLRESLARLHVAADDASSQIIDHLPAEILSHVRPFLRWILDG